MRVDDSHLLGIPRSWTIITISNPNHEEVSLGYPVLSDQATAR